MSQKRDSEYWKKRFEELERAQHDKARVCYEDVEKMYRRAQNEIEKEIAKWHYRFARNNMVSLADARQMLTGRELEELRWDINEYMAHGEENAVSGAWIKQLENASARYHVSRLEALKLQTQQQMEVLFGNQLDRIDTAMKDIYTSGYYKTAFELQKGIGVGWDFASLDNKTISKVISKPWAVDGKNFSERIWNNRSRLIDEMHKTLTQNIMLGQDPQKAIKAISERMKVSKVNAGRLVMTEEAFFSSAAQKECFAELGVEQFQIVATLDSHTSQLCRDMDGKHFPMSEYKIGVTAPPFHVNCRSTTCPYFDDEFADLGERAARGADGKTYFVPANMTYREWEAQFVNASPDYMSNSFRPHYGNEKEIQIDKLKMNVRPVSNSKFDMLTDTQNPRSKAVRLAEKMFTDIKNELPETFELPQIAVVDFEKQNLNANAIGGYHRSSGILFINSKYDTKQKILDFVSKNQGFFANNTEYAPYLHELGHKFYYDMIEDIAKSQKIVYSEAKRDVDKKIIKYIDDKCQGNIKNIISRYANDGYLSGEYTEVCAECFTVKDNNAQAKDIILLIKEMR